MSFTNNVYGGVPQNEMVFTTSNVSSDNASFINLSVSGYATISNLTTINWSQPNLNASTVVTDTLVATNTSAVNLDVSGVMNISNLNISDLNASDISVSTLSVGDIVIDEAEVTTLRFDDVSNANYSEIQRDNDTLTIAGGYLNGVGHNLMVISHSLRIIYPMSRRRAWWFRHQTAGFIFPICRHLLLTQTA